MAPLLVELPTVPFAVLIDALIDAGIEVLDAGRAASGSGRESFVCRRGAASFELDLVAVEGGVEAAFWADTTGWTRWNWLLQTLAAVVAARRNVRLQYDAERVLARFGGRPWEPT